jgi:hypothetical protein
VINEYRSLIEANFFHVVFADVKCMDILFFGLIEKNSFFDFFFFVDDTIAKINYFWNRGADEYF